MQENLILSKLGHTWIFDLDGTVVKHNGYKIDGADTFLEGAKDFLENIPPKDMIIFITSRTDDEREITEKFLRENHVRHNAIIYNAPLGERILLNDNKPKGLITALAVQRRRDIWDKLTVIEDENI